jgi:pilus assembly protein TadC
MKCRLLAIGIGLSAALLVGSWPGAIVGAVVATGLWWWLPGVLAARPTAEQVQSAAELPLAADLIAAALQVGVPVDQAVRAVGEALSGALGARLVSTANALRLGERPEQAWRYLVDLPGGSRVARVATRSADSGAALADALRRLADDLRTARLAAIDAQARRAAVLVVVPLGLCFLPAFLLTGVVPVIIAVLNEAFG